MSVAWPYPTDHSENLSASSKNFFNRGIYCGNDSTSSCVARDRNNGSTGFAQSWCNFSECSNGITLSLHPWRINVGAFTCWILLMFWNGSMQLMQKFGEHWGRRIRMPELIGECKIRPASGRLALPRRDALSVDGEVPIDWPYRIIFSWFTPRFFVKWSYAASMSLGMLVHSKNRG